MISSAKGNELTEIVAASLDSFMTVLVAARTKLLLDKSAAFLTLAVAVLNSLELDPTRL